MKPKNYHRGIFYHRLLPLLPLGLQDLSLKQLFVWIINKILLEQPFSGARNCFLQKYRTESVE